MNRTNSVPPTASWPKNELDPGSGLQISILVLRIE